MFDKINISDVHFERYERQKVKAYINATMQYESKSTPTPSVGRFTFKGTGVNIDDALYDAFTKMLCGHREDNFDVSNIYSYYFGVISDYNDVLSYSCEHYKDMLDIFAMEYTSQEFKNIKIEL